MAQLPEDLIIEDGDSNTVCTAKGVLQMAWYAENKPPHWELRLGLALAHTKTHAAEVLDALED